MVGSLEIQFYYQQQYMEISDNESNSSEGFFAPQMSVLKNQQQQFASINIDDASVSQANELVSYQRPTDFIPRTIFSAGTYSEYPHQLKSKQSEQLLQQMLPIPVQKNKQKRYGSLKDKYINNNDYVCVYSKLRQNSEFDGYIFCLEKTPDYNPDDYLLPMKNKNEGQSNDKFESRFQSGNLLYSYQRQNTNMEEYDLIMQNDTNTKGYNQWFYFRFSNRNAKVVRFNIVNFVKKKLMFLNGVRPVGFSIKSKSKNWHFVGENISYSKSFINREVNNPQGSPTVQNYYTLSFDIHFANLQDQYYIAMNYPYTYTDMVSFTDQLLATCPSYLRIERQILCYSISNNPIICLRIQHKEGSQKGKIVCLGRQHPGQSVGSFVLQGFIKQIIKEEKLLRNYELVVIPMLNPDGVIMGNFRTNLSGFDLNRQWVNPNRWLHPQIYFIKRYLSSLSNITFCIDFHGHSKMLNTFIYSCIDECPSDFRVFPFIYGDNSQYFSIKDCTFSITPDKFRTARVNIYNQIKKPYVYTLQTSFFGYNKNQKTYRFMIEDLFRIGKEASNSLEIMLNNKNKMKAYEQQVRDKSYMFDQWAYENRENLQSQSNPSEDQLTPIERKVKVMSDLAIKKKSKKLKKKKKNKSKVALEKISVKKFSSKRLSQRFIITKKDKVPQAKVIEMEIVKQKIVETVKIAKQKVQKNQKTQSNNNIILNKAKIGKPQFIEKTRPIQDFQELKEGIKKQLYQISKQRESIQNKQQIMQQQKQQIKAHSNLLQASGYNKYRQEKLKMMQQERKLSEAQYYISIMNPSSLKSPSRLIFGEENLEKQRQRQKQKSKRQKSMGRQKVYVIKEHKIINSITRGKEEEIKQQLEKEIQNRTSNLKNCQKILNHMGLEKQIDKNPLNSFEPEERVHSLSDNFKNRTFLKPIMHKHSIKTRHSERLDRGGVFFYN